MKKNKLNCRISLFLLGILQFLFGLISYYYSLNKIVSFIYFSLGLLFLILPFFIKTAQSKKIIIKINMSLTERIFQYVFLALLLFCVAELFFSKGRMVFYLLMIDVCLFNLLL